MPSCLSLDPGSSFGLALVHAATPRHQVAAVRLLLPDPWQDMGRVMEVVRNLPGDCHRSLCIERNAFTARADVGPRNAGEVAWSQGYKVGLLAEALRPYTEGPPRFVGSGEWRKAMLIYAGRQGLVMQAPTKASLAAAKKSEVVSAVSAGGKIVATFRCGHTATLPDRSTASCSICARPTGQDISSAWKATACRFVAELWPEVYAALKASASSRILGKIERPDHELPGLDDACEAIAIGIWGVETAG